jgi:ligand-binding SRPBCC domain-containing protein
MRIRVETLVEQDYRSVFAAFDVDLFVALNPPFPVVRVRRFDGCARDDTIDLTLDFGLFRWRWLGRVVEAGGDTESLWFVDEGIVLPFFLRRWRHRHVVRRADPGAVIVDEIEFEASGGPLGSLLWPLLWLQFLYRKPVYRRRFARAA